MATDVVLETTMVRMNILLLFMYVNQFYRVP
jgi:hypothetical protein